MNRPSRRQSPKSIKKENDLVSSEVTGPFKTPKYFEMKQATEMKGKTGALQKHTSGKQTVTFLELLLPPGIKFDDIYMDAPQVAQELHISKRVVRNIRLSGKISYTNPFGKIFYYRQEIAAIMEANKKGKKGI